MTETKDPIEPSIKWVVIVGIAMFILWLANLFWGIWAMDNNANKGGEWGDIFGAVNALFSGAAFIMIFRGYEMQRYEVDLAKAELAKSKEQTRDQKAALDNQNEATAKQIFDNTFFKLLDNFNSLISGIDLRGIDNSITSTARDSLREFSRRVEKHCFTYLENNKFLSIFPTNNFDNNSYDFHYEKFLDRKTTIEEEKLESAIQSLSGGATREYTTKINIPYGGGDELFPYFRTFYVILKYIDDSSFKDEDKATYIRIFRSMLSEGELKLIAYNCLSKHAIQGGEFITKKLIEKYHLLEHLKDEKLKNILTENGYMDETAFSKKDV